MRALRQAAAAAAEAVSAAAALVSQNAAEASAITAKTQATNAATSASAASAREYRLKRIYGITEEQYEEILQKQKGTCALCSRSTSSGSKRLAVDHDHRTGEIRGLLCYYCNTKVVGRHREGRLLRTAADYLDKKHTGWFVPEKRPKRRRKKKNAARK